MAVTADEPRDPDEELITLIDAASDEELGFDDAPDAEDFATAAEELAEWLDAWTAWAGEA